MNAGRAVFEAVANFSGVRREADSTSAALGRTKTAAENVGNGIPADGGQAAKGLQSIGKRAGEIGQKVSRAGQNVSLKLGTPLTLLGGTAIHTFANFEKALVSAKLKTGATSAEFEQMRKLALKMGAATAFSAGDAAQSLDNLAALGFNAQQAMQTLPAVMNAAQASGEDLGLTTDVVAKAMNAFNIKAKDSSHVADVFAQAANTTALNMTDLSYGLANAGEVGPRFGQKMEGVVAVLGRLVDKGVPAASAGVAIRQALTSLATPTDKASGYLETLGIKVRDAHGNMKQMPALMEELQKGLSLSNPKLVEAAKASHMSGQEFKDAALKAIGMTQGAKAISLAISKGKPVILDAQKDTKKLAALQDGLAQTMGKKAAKAWIAAHTAAGKFKADSADAVKAIDAMGKASDGTSKKMADAFQDTESQKIDNLKGSLETLAITLIGAVAPGLKKVTDKITTFVNKITKFSDKHDWFGPLIIGVGLFLVALGPVMIVVGNLLKLFGGITKAGGKIGKAIGKVTGRGKTPTTTGAAGADVGAQQVWWTKAMPVYLSKAAPASKTTPGAPGTPGAPAGGPAKPTRGARARSAVAGAGKRAGGAALAGGIAAAVAGGDPKEIAKTAGIFAGLELALEGVTKGVEKMGPHIAKAVGKVGRLAKAWVGAAATAAKAAGRMALAAAKVAAKWAWMALQATVNATKMALAWVVGVVRSAASAVASMAVAVASVVAGWVLMGVQALLQAAKVAAAWLISMGPILLVIAAVALAAFLIYKYWDQIKAAVSKAIDWIIGFVKAHWPLLVGILLGPFGLIVALIIKHWGAVKHATMVAIRFVLKIVKTVMHALVRAWHAAWDTIKKVASAVWSGIKKVVSLYVRGMVAVVKTYLKILKAVWSAVWDAIKKIASTVWDGIKKIVSLAIKGVKTTIRVGIDTVKRIWNGLKALGGVAKKAFETVKTAIGNAIDWIVDKIQAVLDKIGDVLGAIGKVKDIAGSIGGKVKGLIPGFSTGGEVPGSGRGDIVSARLEPGEFVVRRAVAQKILPILRDWNRNGAPGRSASLLGPKLAANAMRASISASGLIQSAEVPTGPRITLPKGRGPGGGGDVHVTVHNPVPERASTSTKRVLARAAYDNGWGTA